MDTRLRLLFVNDFLQRVGGAENYVYDLMALLETRGHATMLIAGSRISGPGSLVSRWFSPAFYLQTSRAIKHFRPNIVHIHGCTRNVSPSPAVAARRAGIPVVMTVHDAQLVCPKTWMIYADGQPCQYGFGPRCPVSNCYTNLMGLQYLPYHAAKAAKVWLHRQILKRTVDIFVSPSRWLSEWLERSLGRVTVFHIPHYCPLQAPQRTRVPGPDLGVLYVGRLSREKGVDVLLRAAAISTKRTPRISITIVGDGPAGQALRKLADELGLGSVVTFCGAVPREELEGIYGTGSVLVMPSIWMENAPLVALEAMSRGLPIIASARGGLAELVREGANGLLFRAGDSQDLADKIIRLAQEPDLLEELGIGSLREAEKYTASGHVEALEKVYRLAVAKCTGPRGEFIRPYAASRGEDGN